MFDRFGCIGKADVGRALSYAMKGMARLEGSCDRTLQLVAFGGEWFS
jgi:hypothetical protein